MGVERKFRINPRRFKDLILYISERLADDSTFGSTKLNKVLWFSDFEAYRSLGEPITGAQYMKNLYGPTAREFVPLLNELLRDDQVEIAKRVIAGHPQDVTSSKVSVDLDLSEAELQILDSVIEDLRGKTAGEVSDLSHEQSPGWQLTDYQETIPYESALISTEVPNDEALDYFRKLHGLAA